ncbi:hypothetical protein ACGLHR_25795 [Cupriavidus sp. CuC1]
MLNTALARRMPVTKPRNFCVPPSSAPRPIPDPWPANTPANAHFLRVAPFPGKPPASPGGVPSTPMQDEILLGIKALHPAPQQIRLQIEHVA